VRTIAGKMYNLVKAIMSQRLFLIMLIWSSTLPPVTGSFSEFIITIFSRFAVLSLHMKFKGMNRKEIREINKIIGGMK